MMAFQESGARRWWVRLSTRETAVLYLSRERMDWLRRRLRAGRYDLPDAAADRLFSREDLSELRAALVERDLAERDGADVRILPAAAQAILLAAGEAWGMVNV